MKFGVVFANSFTAEPETRSPPPKPLATLDRLSGGRTDVDGVRQLEDLGVTRMIISPPAFDAAGVRDGLAKFGDEIISRAG